MYKEGSDVYSFNPLWKLLIDRGIKKMEFRDLVGISNGTLAKLGKNENVSMEKIEKICIVLDCNIENMVEIQKKFYIVQTIK